MREQLGYWRCAVNEGGLDIKSCCASFYQSDWVRLLIGPVFHPGGLSLTHHLGELLSLSSADRVLDIACGQGATAVYLAQTFGCHVTGIDYGAENITQALLAAKKAGLTVLTEFYQGDAEHISVRDGSFDVVISECSFCTFPDKVSAAREMARLLRPDGRLGLSDIAVNGLLPDDLKTLVAWVACIADAQPVDEYLNIFKGVGFTDFMAEDHAEALQQMVADIQRKLLTAELAAKLGKLSLDCLNLEDGKQLARRVAEMINQGRITYMTMIARG